MGVSPCWARLNQVKLGTFGVCLCSQWREGRKGECGGGREGERGSRDCEGGWRGECGEGKEGEVSVWEGEEK